MVTTILKEPLHVKRKALDTRTHEKLVPYWSYLYAEQIVKANKLPRAQEECFALIDLPENINLNTLRGTLYELQVKGYRLILANVESYGSSLNLITQLEELKKSGVFIHVNEKSLLGENGREMERHAIKLCRKQLVSLIACLPLDREVLNVIPTEIEKKLKSKISRSYIDYLKENRKKVSKNQPFLPFPRKEREFGKLWRSVLSDLN